MKKYLVDVYLPALGNHYDVYLPAGKRIDEAIELLGNIVESLSRGVFIKTEYSILLNAQNGEPLDSNQTVHDAGIRNSSNLLLI